MTFDEHCSKLKFVLGFKKVRRDIMKAHSTPLHIVVGFLLLFNAALVFWFEFIMKGNTTVWFPVDSFTVVMSLIAAFMIFRSRS